MRVFLTGATGYLGGAILREGLARGYAIRVLSRRTPQANELPEGVEWYLGDLSRPECLREGMRDADAVIHTAGLVSIWRHDPRDFYRVNGEGTHNILRAAVEAGISRIVYTSSFFALGPTEERPADETWNNPDPTCMTDYGRSKYESLMSVRQRITEGLPVIPLYPVLIYGPGKSTQGNLITQLINDYWHRKIPGCLGDGNRRWTFSYVEDVAKGHWLALEKGQPGEDYILGGEDATLNELFAMLYELTGVRPPRWKIPYSFAKGLGWIEELRARLSSHYVPQLTRRVVEVYKHHWRYSSQKAISELGYLRTPLKIGVIKTLESLGFTLPENRSTIL